MDKQTNIHLRKCQVGGKISSNWWQIGGISLHSDNDLCMQCLSVLLIQKSTYSLPQPNGPHQADGDGNGGPIQWPVMTGNPHRQLCVLNQLLLNQNIILPYSYRAFEKEWS